MVTRFVTVLAMSFPAMAFAAGPYFATGIKIGEVDSTSALVWVRLTERETRVGSDAPIPEVMYMDDETGALVERQGRSDMIPVVSYPDGSDIDTIEGAVPGAAGTVRLKYGETGTDGWTEVGPVGVNPYRDYTAQIPLSGLTPATDYALEVTSNGGETITGGFRTAPTADSETAITFVVTTGTAYPDRDAGDEGYHMYSGMAALEPDFFVHTGDVLYYDYFAKSEALARWHWARMYSLPSNVKFHRSVASYFMKDDHETLVNDCWPGMQTRFMGDLTFQQGLDIFREQVPMGARTYRTVRWGRDLQVWMVEGRDFRDPNHGPDGPSKSIWGFEQKNWLKRSMAQSDAAFRVLISPTPIVGPDRERKSDNHSNDVYASEGREVRAFLASLKNAYVVCGDRHWQYVSVDTVTGLKEYSCGPASDQHAGGWSQDDVRPEHEYLNVTGGFLSVTVARENGTPVLTATHHDEFGEVLHVDRTVAE